ncbi:N-acetylmuramoyl-L-alanine amidase AmiC precursor [bacterium BMS3Abin07]|nr:N-acetylmuramoyl-L-alanine amidase AmiC precursor [bacterium BMS3Abin07]GBE31624.1 N-acetylmuramoyl-L-alanine amidase AmiC precursor [bacterium BMS3Bbin05]HDO21902.1 N-acetylmuramoyl-L-alanine amidase [Nitrospirota bacterium]HDZ87323.1 N-acetylmuramoyl-L-alanine amidase [Nitrospirota bacterium]
MISDLFADREERNRKAILRGIYEDNLFVMGKRKRVARYRRLNPVLKGGAIFVFVIFFILTGRFSSSDPANFIEGHDSLYGSVAPVPHEVSETPSGNEDNVDSSYFNYLLSNSSESLKNLFGFKVKTIVIDPGHGGDDPGAIGTMQTREKDITLDIARRLKKRLSRFKNYQIYMTRETDVTMPLDERIKFANAHNADLYISIHINYVPRKPINLIETYYFGTYTDKDTLKLAEKENEGAQYTLSAFDNILRKIGNTMKFQESRRLAASIQKSLFENISKENNHILDYGIKTAPFIVLLGVNVPSVLTEISCISNREEEKKLTSGLYREEIASYLDEGIVGYLNENPDKGDARYAAR